jgi:hypothetical protein
MPLTSAGMPARGGGGENEKDVARARVVVGADRSDEE